MKTILSGVALLLLARSLAPADPGDVAGSHDYPGFARYPNFVITDYDEDNPATADFPVAQPLPLDAAHLETVHLTGHRYLIRYELNPGANPPSIPQVQDDYEKLAAAAHFTLEKSGAVGDVTETFRQVGKDRQTWVHLEPGTAVIVLTVMESTGPAIPLDTAAASSAAAPAPSAPTPAATPPASIPAAIPAPAEDPLYLALLHDGHVLLPLTFLPGKLAIDPAGKPLIDRVVQMLRRHPDLRLTIEGYTDNTGSAGGNLRLSEERARTIRGFLVAGGIERRRLDALGFGGEKPIAPNNTAEGRAQNRRIELVLRR